MAKKISVDMGAYYTNLSQKNLVRTICRATTPDGKEPLIVFSFVGKDGIVSNTYYMSENEFITNYLL